MDVAAAPVPLHLPDRPVVVLRLPPRHLERPWLRPGPGRRRPRRGAPRQRSRYHARRNASSAAVPFLRVIRDKRGYETTYLMHWYREGNRQRSRILYVFRTPGGVRVGREALEPDVLREIESEYPDIDFDWPVVVENQQVVEPMPETYRSRKKRRPDEEAAPIPASATPTPAPAPEGPPAAVAPVPMRPSVPSAIEGATPDEQIAFLAYWYPLIRDRIPQRIADPARQETLLALVERLNPAMWSDADQITTGLQQATEALERLARVLARRRRRARRSRKADQGTAGEPGSPPLSDRSTPDA
jgi:hypothetical protein